MDLCDSLRVETGLPIGGFLSRSQRVWRLVETHLPKEIEKVKKVIEAEKAIELEKTHHEMKQKAMAMGARLNKIAGSPLGKRTAEEAGLEEECSQLTSALKKLRSLEGVKTSSEVRESK